MSKIKVIPDDRIEALLPQKTFMRVVATTLDGRQPVVEVSNPLGHPDNPMQDRHIEEKIYFLSRAGAGQGSLRRGPRNLVVPRARDWSECRDEVARD